MRTTIGERAAPAERREVLRALAVLDPRDRAVVRHLYLLRRTPVQAAVVLGITVEEVHRRASHAVGQLCARYREYV